MTRLPPDLEDNTPSLSASFEGAPEVSPADKVPRMELSLRPAEETSLERRVLAHERILQIVGKRKPRPVFSGGLKSSKMPCFKTRGMNFYGYAYAYD